MYGRFTNMTISVIRTCFAGRSVPGFTANFSKTSSTSSPPTRFPNTVCFLSRWGVGLNVMNHWDLNNPTTETKWGNRSFVTNAEDSRTTIG